MKRDWWLTLPVSWILLVLVLVLLCGCKHYRPTILTPDQFKQANKSASMRASSLIFVSVKEMQKAINRATPVDRLPEAPRPLHYIAYSPTVIPVRGAGKAIKFEPGFVGVWGCVSPVDNPLNCFEEDRGEHPSEGQIPRLKEGPCGPVIATSGAPFCKGTCPEGKCKLFRYIPIDLPIDLSKPIRVIFFCVCSAD